MLQNLQVIFFLVCLVIENFRKLFMRRLAIGNIVVYRITIIPNTSDKMANYIELRVVKGWST